jgi:antitoxin HigA-1
VGVRVKNVAPITPGEVLRDDVLARCDLTQETLADALGVSRLTINQIINGRRSITADMAVRLSHVLSTSAEFWLKLQMDVDVHEARQRLAKELDRLEVIKRPRGAPRFQAAD